MLLVGESPSEMEVELATWELRLILAGSLDSAAGRKAYEVLKSNSTPLGEGWMGLFAAKLGDWEQVDRWGRRAEMHLRDAGSMRDTVRSRLYRGHARLFRALAAQRRGDSTAAVDEMRAAVRDWPVNGWGWGTDRFMRHEIGRMLIAAGDLPGAARYLESFAPFDWVEMPALVEYDLGRISERLGDREQARYHYSRMVRWWQDADPELKPLWEEGRRALARVTAEQ